ncbi:Stress-induced-phosphoprotein 1 [Porites harrisoni]
MQLGTDARSHFAMRARFEMQQGNYQEALRFLSMALSQIPPFLVQVAAPLLADRAECFWQLGDAGKAVQEMMEATNAGLPAYGENSKQEAWKWTNRGFRLYEQQNYYVSELCASIALHFNAYNPHFTTPALLCRAVSRYELGNIQGTLSDAEVIEGLDKQFATTSAHSQKEAALEQFEEHNYEQALKLLKLALLLHPKDSSGLKFRRFVESHQAAAYFKLKKYRKALEVGETSYWSNSSQKSTEEAKIWKERGNHVSKEPNSVELAIAYYSLALGYTPPYERDLKATILSNRSLMYKKTGKDEEALRDALQCVQNNPNWAKAQYRLGSCLFARERLKEALDAFSKSLHLLLKHSSSSEKDTMDTLNQLLLVALKHPGGTSGIHYSVPRNLLQTVITEAVDDKDWYRLHLLFMGGGGEKRFQKGSGGLGTGCDASSVPLEEVIHCDFKDLTDFISVLLDHKASCDPPKGRENPVDVAIQLHKFDVVNVLMNRCKKAGPFRETTSTSKPVKRTFKADALEAIRKDDNGKAIELLKLSLKHEKSGIEEERKTLKSLCELYFRETSFKECLETGKKLKSTFWGEKSEDNNSFRIEQAKQWKKWGNELHKGSKYEFMAEFYSLALAFTPLSNKEITTALLSNRCLAFNKLEKFKEALADAEECIKIKPEWFRGHSRQGTCLCHLKRKEEALEAFCKAHTYALTEKDKNATADDVISVAMDIKDGESRITCHFSPDTLEHLVKEASERNEWKKLRFLFLGSAEIWQSEEYVLNVTPHVFPWISSLSPMSRIYTILFSISCNEVPCPMV